MAYSEPARARLPRNPRIIVAGLLVVMSAVAAALVSPLLAPSASSSTAASPLDAPSSLSTTAPPVHVPAEHRTTLGEADGIVPNGKTVFDEDVPAVAKLDRALLAALRRAATAAADDGVRFLVNSGWRS